MEQLNGAQQVVRVLEDLGVQGSSDIQELLLQIYITNYLIQKRSLIH